MEKSGRGSAALWFHMTSPASKIFGFHKGLFPRRLKSQWGNLASKQIHHLFSLFKPHQVGAAPIQ